MARTPGSCCLIDVRTAAICQDYIIATDPCAPGAAAAVQRRKASGGSYLLDNCQPPACGYDRKKDMVSAMGAFFLIATCLGVIHTSSIFIPMQVTQYNAGFLELCLIAAATYLVAILTACASLPIIEFAGHKLTALFGMTILFVGVLLDSQVFHVSMIYVGNIGMVGLGAGLAYAASATLPSDLFRQKILSALLIMDIAGSVGTIFFTWVIVLVVDVLGYKWSKLIVALLALFFTLGVHAFPKTRLLYASGCDASKPDKTAAIRECIYKNSNDGTPKSPCDEGSSTNWLCVCVCDLRLYGDRSFMLWAILVMVATMNFHLPYLFIVSFAETQGAKISPWYITFFCVGSIVTRASYVNNADYTFRFNRLMFQVCLAGSGTMWIVICWTETFGWIMVCAAVLGAIEGILCVVISRLALGTIPRRWIGGAWITCIIFHALGMFVMSIFTAAIAMRTRHYYAAFITSGIIQIIVAILAILLPNEEDEGSGVAAPQPTVMANYKPPYSTGLGQTRSNFEYMRSSYGVRSPGTGLSGLPPSSGTTKRSIDYKCQCPICSKIGCIPGCLPQTCTPGGSLNQQPQ